MVPWMLKSPFTSVLKTDGLKKNLFTLNKAVLEFRTEKTSTAHKKCKINALTCWIVVKKFRIYSVYSVIYFGYRCHSLICA